MRTDVKFVKDLPLGLPCADSLKTSTSKLHVYISSLGADLQGSLKHNVNI